MLTQQISRGKLNVSIHLDDTESQRKVPVVDAQKLANYMQILRKSKQALELMQKLN